MADQITQTLGFDVTQALDALKRLDAGFLSTNTKIASLADRMRDFNKVAQVSVQLLDQIAQKSSKLPGSIKLPNIPPPQQQPGNNPGGGGGVGSGGGQNSPSNNFLPSLETASRVVFTQLIVRGLTAVRSAITDSIESNLAFVKSLSEIATIAPQADRSIGALASRTRELSDSFNAPLLEVTAGLYETISSNFQGAAESQEILTASLKFGKAALVSVDDSVKLLTGTLNAYGKGSEEAEAIAGKFFKTIELGRVTGSELVTAFGRVQQVGSEVGVSISELDAAFSSLTISGVNADEAATQIRAALTALLKPSEAAKAAFRQLGIESAEQLIAAEGLQGSFQKLIATTDGSARSIAALFPNVRALNGVLRLTGEVGAKTFVDHLDQIDKAARETLNRAYSLRIDTNAEEVAAELNKLKNFFTVDIGTRLISANKGFLDFVGGIDNLTQAFESAVPLIVAATAAMVLFGVAMTAVAAKAQLAKVAVGGFFGGIAAGIGLGLAAQGLGDFIGNQIADSIINADEALKKSQNSRLEFERTRRDAEIQLEETKNARILAATAKFSNQVRKTYFDQVDAAKDSNQQILADTQDILDRIIQARQKHATDLRKIGQESEQAVVASQNRVQSLQGQLEDRQFGSQNSRFNDLQQSFRLQQRAAQLAGQGSSSLRSAQTESQINNALGVLTRAQKAAEEAVGAATNTGNLTAKLRAEQSVQNVLQQQIAAEKQLQVLKAKDAAIANKAAAEEEARVDRLRLLAKEIVKDSNLFDKKGVPLPTETRSTNIQKVSTNLDKFAKEAFSGEKFDVAQLFDFAKLRDTLLSRVSGAEINKLDATPGSLKNLNSQIQGNLDKIGFLVKLAPDQKALKGLDTSDTLDETNRQISEQVDLINRAKKVDAERLLINQQTNDAKTRINENLKDDIFNSSSQFSSPTAGKLADQIKELANSPDAAKFRALAEEASKFAASNPGRFAFDGISNSQSLKLALAVKNLQEILTLQEKQKKNDASAPSDTQLNSAFQTLDALKQNGGIQELLKTPAEDAGKMNTNLSGSADSLKESATASGTVAQNQASIANDTQRELAARRALKALEAQGGGGGEGAVEQRFGGLIRAFQSGGLVKGVSYFDRGGMAARGTDTIPAMLSPGEFVVNAASTRKFYSQIQAINAGIAPVYKETGGNVTNNTIGDIKVNVNSGGNAKQTGRAIAAEIRHELRRQTSRV